jgi:inhibitor of KinA sporulation pathway (predicted exonuclease)
MTNLQSLSSAIYLDLEWDRPTHSAHECDPLDIIEVGLVELDTASLKIVREANYLVRPRLVDIALGTSTLTGISRADLLRASNFRKVIEKISTDWPAKATCFAWGADGEILSRACHTHRVEMPFRRFVDLGQQVQNTLLLLQPLSVRNAIKALDLPFDGAMHMAVADARNTARIHAEILRRIRSCAPPPIVHQDGDLVAEATWFGKTLQSSLTALDARTSGRTPQSRSQQK